MRVTKRSLHIIGSVLAVAVFASSVQAQVLPRNKPRATNQNPPTQPAQPTTRAQEDVNVSTTVNARTDSMNVLRSTQIVGSMISLGANQQLGRITDVVFLDNGCDYYVVADFNG